MKLRITGDMSLPKSIEITQADTGAKVTNVLCVDIHISPNSGESYITLQVWGAELDVTGELRPQVSPSGTLIESQHTT